MDHRFKRIMYDVFWDKVLFVLVCALYPIGFGVVTCGSFILLESGNSFIFILGFVLIALAGLGNFYWYVLKKYKEDYGEQLGRCKLCEQWNKLNDTSDCYGNYTLNMKGLFTHTKDHKILTGANRPNYCPNCGTKWKERIDYWR